MTRKGIGAAVGILGGCFLVFYLVVRLLLMEQLDSAVAEANVHSLRDLLSKLSGPLLIWALWAYSFRVGMFLAVVGGALHSGMRTRWLGLLVVGGSLYLASSYVPFVDYSPRYFGILGTTILVLFLFLVWDWTRRRPTLPDASRVASDLRMAGYYFLVTATWSLCGIFGIVTYALPPQIMLARGLQPAAVMLTSHVMAELTLGWLLLFLASRKEPVGPSVAPASPAHRPPPASV